MKSCTSEEAIPDFVLGEPYSFTEYDCQSIAMSEGECIVDVSFFYLGT